MNHHATKRGFTSAGATLAMTCAALLALGAGPAPAPAQTLVPSNWGAIPDGLGEGDRFRLLIVTRHYGASGETIEDYNSTVRGEVAFGHSAIGSYANDFKVVGCTDEVNARENTGTAYTTARRGVPIYWLSGNKVADHYEDFYDGSWDDEEGAKTARGNDFDYATTDDFPFTGCEHDGTAASAGGDSYTLGQEQIRVGAPGDSRAGYGPINGEAVASRADQRPIYGLSGVFEVERTTPIVNRRLPMVRARAELYFR